MHLKLIGYVAACLVEAFLDVFFLDADFFAEPFFEARLVAILSCLLINFRVEWHEELKRLRTKSCQCAVGS